MKTIYFITEGLKSSVTVQDNIKDIIISALLKTGHVIVKIEG